MMFANSFAVNGMCSPCRATIFTGLIPSRHGVHSWLDDRYAGEWPDGWCAISEFRSLASTLAGRGYQTAMIGKYHLGQPHAPMPGFDEWLAFDLGHTVTFYDNTVIDRGRRRKQVRGQHLADFFTERAVDYITQVDLERPFFLNVNYNAPYLLPPTNLGPDRRNRFYERYAGRDLRSFPRTAISEEILARIDGPDDERDLYRHHRFNLMRMHNDPASMANVCAQVTLVDDGIGQLLRALESRGLAETTLVAVTSDQANLYGQHGLWGQTIETTPSHLYDAALRNPLLFWHPEHLCTEVVPECLIGQYDLAPTLLDYLGFSDVRFDGSPGRSFAMTLRSGLIPESWPDAVFFEQEESRGIRTADFAYWTRIPGTGPPVLFDQ
jgi:arylsulfatase A-like enzyme